ncbi:MAG: glycosyltransferase family 2 protein, partial [Rhodothermales bacterium]
MSQRIAIASTVRNADPVLDSFITYHLAAGFDHLFLFFDDPEDSALDKARRYTGVSAIPHDEHLRHQWRRSGLFAADFAHEVMGRQVLNLEVALQLAREQQIDWMLHIDHDELFYAGQQTVHEHFASLAARPVQWVKYANYEAVPEQVDIVDYFRETTLFKRSLFDLACLKGGRALPLDRVVRYTGRQQELVDRLPQVPLDLFHFYRKGKAAARVSDMIRPFGVHDFKVPVGQMTYATAPGDPVILHYTCCGFEHFWNKFRTLENTYEQGIETWWGQDVTAHVSSFYLEARDVVSQGDEERARTFYKERYVISDAAQVAAL